MKNLLLLLFALIVSVGVCQPAKAQIVILVQESAPFLEDYKNTFDYFKKVESATFSGGYKDLKLVAKDSKKEKKLSDFSTQEQNVFILELAEKQTKLMTNLQKAWERELKKFDDPAYEPKGEGEKENKPALKTDVEKYNNQLLDLRKKYAIAYEDFADKTLKEFSKLDKKESEFTLNQIRSVHNVEKLIERKKK